MGDLVGHEFHGNQHTDGGGAGYGTAGEKSWALGFGNPNMTTAQILDKEMGRSGPRLLSTRYAATYIEGRKVALVSQGYIERGDAALAEYFNENAATNNWTPTGMVLGTGDMTDQAEVVNSARFLVDGVRSAEPAEVDLYRGINSNHPIPALDDLKPGEEMRLGRITSFTEDQEQANRYGGGSRPYEIRLRGRAQTLPTDQHTSMSHREHVTFGRFRVVETLQEEGGLHGKTVIVVEQEGLR